MTIAGRVTQRNMEATTLSNLQQSMSRLSKLQEQLSSGRVLQRPSDDPAAVVSALQFRAELRRAEQYGRNVQNGLDWLGTADNALTDATDLLTRARELTLTGINDAMGQSAREALAAEVDQLRAGMVSLSNTQFLGRPVFGGTVGQGFGADPANPGGVIFNGSDDDINRTVAPNVIMTVNVHGSVAFGPNGNNVFDILTSISNNLRMNPSALSNDLVRLDTRMQTLTSVQATAGAKFKQLEALQERNDGNTVAKKNSLAELEGVDIAATITELKLQETAHEAALAASAKVIQPSLLDFLR